MKKSYTAFAAVFVLTAALCSAQVLQSVKTKPGKTASSAAKLEESTRITVFPVTPAKERPLPKADLILTGIFVGENPSKPDSSFTTGEPVKIPEPKAGKSSKQKTSDMPFQTISSSEARPVFARPASQTVTIASASISDLLPMLVPPENKGDE